MIKSKKKIINRRKTFQSKKNFMRGGAEAEVIIDEVVHIAEFYMSNPPKDITCLGYYPILTTTKQRRFLYHAPHNQF